MSIRERARAAGAQAEVQYLAFEAERIEQEVAGLRSLLAACVIAYGPIPLTNELLDAATELSCVLRAEEWGLTIDAEPGKQQLTLTPPPTQLHVEGFPGGLNLPPPPSEPPETIPEVETIDDDTTEGRGERYLATHGAVRVQQGSSRPHMRPWDKAEDLAFHEVAQEQPERTSEQLSPGDGSVRVSVS